MCVCVCVRAKYILALQFNEIQYRVITDLFYCNLIKNLVKKTTFAKIERIEFFLQETHYYIVYSRKPCFSDYS